VCISFRNIYILVIIVVEHFYFIICMTGKHSQLHLVFLCFWLRFLSMKYSAITIIDFILYIVLC